MPCRCLERVLQASNESRGGDEQFAASAGLEPTATVGGDEPIAPLTLAEMRSDPVLGPLLQEAAQQGQRVELLGTMLLAPRAGGAE